MSFALPSSPEGIISGKVYLSNCPREDKDDAKKLGAKWDAKKKSWYVLGGETLEPFNRWHPNNRKYIVCSYTEKDNAKKAGARWDATCKQWYFDANDSKAELKLSRWLPSSNNNKASETKTKKKPPRKTKPKENITLSKSKATALTKSELATIPRINDDMTIAQLHIECRTRDPSMKGLSSKNKSWLLDHLKVGSPWISAELSASTKEEPIRRKDPAAAKASTVPAKKSSVLSKGTAKKEVLSPKNIITSSKTSAKKAASVAKMAPKVVKACDIKNSNTISADMTIAQLQMECRARNPDIKGLTNKNKTWLLDHLKIGSRRAPAINANMTVAQLQQECRVRTPDMKGLSNKNKDRLLEHLQVGTAWISWSQWIHADMTVAQLQMECRVRNPEIVGLSNKNKGWLLDHLKIGTMYVSFSQWKNDSRATNANSINKISVTTKPKSASVTKKNGTVTAKAINICDAPLKSNSTPISRQTKLNFSSNSPPVARKIGPKTTQQNADQQTLKKDQKIKTTAKRQIHTGQNEQRDSGSKIGASKKKQKTTHDISSSTIQTSVTSDSSTIEVPLPSTSSAATKYSRITSKMTIEELKKEAEARRLIAYSQTKSRLLQELIEGSICLYKSSEFKAYQSLLNKMKDEKPSLLDVQYEKLEAAAERRERQKEKRRIEKEKKLAEAERAKKEERTAEIAKQASLHIHSFPQVHTCLLAKSSNLNFHGKPRQGSCDVCQQKQRDNYGYYEIRTDPPVYTCESHDWDICAQCFTELNMSQAEKDRIKAENDRLRKERQKKREKERRESMERARKEAEEREEKLDEKRFRSKIRNVKGKHLDPNSSGMKYTVWCKYHHPRDDMEPSKEFDSTWASIEEANSRAEYLFHFKNYWGISAAEIYDDYVEPINNGCLVGWSVTPDHGSTWSVGIVPSEAFPYLDNVSLRRHMYDEPEGSGRSTRWEDDEDMYTMGY